MTNKREEFISDGLNTVFKTEQTYESNSLKVQINIENKLEDVPFTELGEGYVLLSQIPKQGEKIIFTYLIEGDITGNTSLEYSLINRIKTLENIVEELYKSNVILKEALNNRVSVNTFQAWTRLIEKKTGITLVDSPLGYINQELYKNKA